MRKVFAAILAILILTSIIPCTAFAQEYEDMTDQELIAEYNAIRLLLATRGFAAENKRVLFDKKNIQIYINGEYSVDNEWYGTALNIPIVIVNNRDESICVQMRDSSVNGWACDVIFSAEVPAQKKMKDELTFELDGTDVEQLDDFEDAEFSFLIFDNDSLDDICNSDLIRIVAG